MEFNSNITNIQLSFSIGISSETASYDETTYPAIGKGLHDQCLADPLLTEFYHVGEEDNHFHAINNPSGEVFGKIGREEPMELLNTFGPKGTHIQYGRKLNPVEKSNGRLKLMVDDGGNDHTSAFWALHDNFK